MNYKRNNDKCTICEDEVRKNGTFKLGKIGCVLVVLIMDVSMTRAHDLSIQL
jgi:hypothetical protein